MSKKVVISALGAIVAMGIGTQTLAADTKMDMKKYKAPKGMETCFGIAKAGKNDCGVGSLSCSGSAKIDGDKNAFLLVPKGTCDKIVGGTTEAPKA